MYQVWIHPYLQVKNMPGIYKEKCGQQVKSHENIITLHEIKVDKSDQLQKSYIINLKRDICMLETNVNNFS